MAQTTISQRLTAVKSPPEKRRAARLPFQRKRATDPAALDPREFDDPMDVIHELRANYVAYSEGAEAWLELATFPDFVQTAIDRIRSRTFQLGSKPADSAVTCCCLTHGLASLYEHPVIVDAREVRDEFYKSDFEDSHAEEVVASWLRAARVELSIAGGSKSRKHFRIADATKGEVFGLASELGVNGSSVGVLAIMLTLSTQAVVHEQQRERMAEAVASFLRRVELRATGTGALVKALRKL